jgi:hypothetical protein
MGMTVNVGLADGSARAVTSGVTATFKVKGLASDPTVWQWACAIGGDVVLRAPPPSGW